MSDYFDLLPVRPTPQPLESMNSYLTRLAQANGFEVKLRFLSLCFPDQVKNLKNYDFAFLQLHHLATITNLTIEALRATTFYYLAELFYRRTQPKDAGRLVADVVVSHLRYCPMCLHEKWYYSLLWRFQDVVGCLEHDCQLLEKCETCQQLVPLYGTPIKLGECPHCGTDLRRSTAPRLSSYQRQLTQIRAADYAFLLQSHRVQTGYTPGKNLKIARLKLGIADEDLARHLNISFGKLRAIDNDQPNGLTAICILQRYTDYLGTTMRAAFVPQTPQDSTTELVTASEACLVAQNADSREAQVLQQAQQAVQALQLQDLPITQHTVGRQIKQGSPDIRRYSTVINLIKSAQNQQLSREEDILLVAATRFVKEQRQLGSPVRKLKLLQHLRVKQVRINRCYPRLKTYLHDLLQTEAEQQKKTTDAIIEQAQSIIDNLLFCQQPIFKTTLAELMGLSVASLRKYPKITCMLVDARQQQAAQRVAQDQQRCLAIPMAIQRLLDTDEPLYMRTILKELEISAQHINHYPQTIQCIRQAIASHHSSQPRKAYVPKPSMFQQHKYDQQALLNTLPTIVEILLQQPTMITKSGIFYALGVKHGNLPRGRYAELHAAIDNILPDLKLQQKLRLDAELLLQVQKALHQLQVEGLPPVQVTVATMVNTSTTVLMKNPQVKNLLQAAIVTYRQKVEADRLASVERTIQYLQSSGQEATQQAIAQQLNLSVSALHTFPRVATLTNDVIDANRQQFQHHKDALPEKMRAAMVTLEEQGLTITQDAISQIVGVTVGTLSKHPETHAIFDELKHRKKQDFHARDAALLQEVIDAIHQLQQADELVTQKAIAQIIGRAPKGLKYYPRVRTMLKNVVDGKYR